MKFNPTACKYIEQTYQVSLMKIQREFEDAFSSLSIKHPYILFLDGVDARPASIDNQTYFDCITGMIDAVLEINRGILSKKGIKVMPLMRPDVMYRLPVHNMNQKLRNNTVLLNWDTTNRGYVRSKLFKIADAYFERQQDLAYELSVCWNHYFPYSIHSHGREDNPFVEFLRYSSYKPRDILTMLNELVSATQGEHFSHNDFRGILSN